LVNERQDLVIKMQVTELNARHHTHFVVARISKKHAAHLLDNVNLNLNRFACHANFKPKNKYKLEHLPGDFELEDATFCKSCRSLLKRLGIKIGSNG
jgi:hypothetical protein